MAHSYIDAGSQVEERVKMVATREKYEEEGDKENSRNRNNSLRRSLSSHTVK